MTTVKKSAAKPNLEEAVVIGVAIGALQEIAKLPVGASDSGPGRTAVEIAGVALAAMGQES